MERITLPTVNAFSELKKLRLKNKKEEKEEKKEELKEEEKKDEKESDPSITGMESKYYFRRLNKDLKKDKE